MFTAVATRRLARLSGAISSPNECLSASSQILLPVNVRASPTLNDSRSGSGRRCGDFSVRFGACLYLSLSLSLSFAFSPDVRKEIRSISAWQDPIPGPQSIMMAQVNTNQTAKQGTNQIRGKRQRFDKIHTMAVMPGECAPTKPAGNRTPKFWVTPDFDSVLGSAFLSLSVFTACGGRSASAEIASTGGVWPLD